MENEVMVNNVPVEGGNIGATIAVTVVLALATYGGVSLTKKVGKKVIGFFKSKKQKNTEPQTPETTETKEE